MVESYQFTGVVIWIGALCVGYMLGSLPFAVFVSRLYGVDILKEGSGNPGATNVKRVLGGFAGNLVFVLDFFKGVLAASWPIWVLGREQGFLIGVLGLVGGVLGHSFSVFLRFKGGKGVSVMMGGLAILMPWGLMCGIILWGIIFFSTRYVSLASIGFGMSLPVSQYFFDGSKWSVMFGAVLGLFILLRHVPNIRRLLKGEENRFAKDKEK